MLSKMAQQTLSDIPSQVSLLLKGCNPGVYGLQVQSQGQDFLVFTCTESFLEDNGPDFKVSDQGSYQEEFEVDGTEDYVAILRSASKEPLEVVYRVIPMEDLQPRHVQQPHPVPQKQVHFEDEMEQPPPPLLRAQVESKNVSTKVVLGVLIVAVVGYLIYNNFVDKNKRGTGRVMGRGMGRAPVPRIPMGRVR